MLSPLTGFFDAKISLKCNFWMISCFYPKVTMIKLISLDMVNMILVERMMKPGTDISIIFRKPFVMFTSVSKAMEEQSKELVWCRKLKISLIANLRWGLLRKRRWGKVGGSCSVNVTDRLGSCSNVLVRIPVSATLLPNPDCVTSYL